MIGGLLGLVGLGSVKGSQKTTPREALLGLSLTASLASEAEATSFSLVAKIELCETPVEWDFEINEAAEGVAF